MKFSKVIGKIDKSVIEQAEKALTFIFTELGLRVGNNNLGTKLGGDPLLFSLLYPIEHYATLNIPTAGTDGRRYYWNPKFILKLLKRTASENRIGLRIVCAHEGLHAVYMHPQRRGHRNPKLWNIAVDFLVNYTILVDLKGRGVDPVATFQQHLGNFVTLKDYAEFLKNPYLPINGSDKWVPEPPDEDAVDLPKPDDDRELTEEEKKELAKKEAKIKYFFADPDLPEDLRRPEKIYDYLYSLIPKCPECGKMGMHAPPADQKNKDKSKKQDKKEDKSSDEKDKKDASGKKDGHEDHNHSECGPGDSSCGSSPSDNEGEEGEGPGSESGCGTCGGLDDIFGFGDTLDDHMDTEGTEEETAKRLADAIESTKRMAGSVPGHIMDELDTLIAPKVRWQDFIRVRMTKARVGNTKKDWTSFKTRPMFAGLMVPKRYNQICTFGCLLDTSGSMSVDDMTFGVSQLQSIDQKSEGWIVPADATIYWDEATKIRRANASEISRVKVVGRGGTVYGPFFKEYKERMGKVDFLIIITDGGLMPDDVASMVNPGVPVYWLITSGYQFKEPFGKVFDLK